MKFRYSPEVATAKKLLPMILELDKSLMLQESGMIPEDVNFGIPNKRIEKLTSYSPKVNIYTDNLELEKLYEALLPSVVMILNIVDDQN